MPRGASCPVTVRAVQRIGARYHRGAMDRRRMIERWFAGRGVPQMIAGYSSEQRMDARALPFIAAWILAGTILIWARQPDATLAENAVGTDGVRAAGSSSGPV